MQPLFPKTRTQFLYYNIHRVKSVRIWSYSGLYFLAFGLNTQRYSVSLHIQSECRKMWTRITPNTNTFHAVIAKNEETFGILLFYYIQKTNKLSVKFLLSDHFLMIGVICYTQSKPKHVTYSTQHALILQCQIPSSKFEVKMEGIKFYETLYKKAIEFACSKDLIQQTA